MADALALGASGVTHGGSSPLSGTDENYMSQSHVIFVYAEDLKAGGCGGIRGGRLSTIAYWGRGRAQQCETCDQVLSPALLEFLSRKSRICPYY